MSSAILYVAIVAIWACVLIPRWLRRTPPVTVAEFAEPAAPSQDVEFSGSSPASQSSAYVDMDDLESAEDFSEDSAEARDPDSETAEADDGGRPQRAPLTRAESRRRMLAARRRLLMLLLGLETAACALPALDLAALWVVIPPSVMLVGYMLLLREASKADREQSQRDAEAAQARSRAKEHTRTRATSPAAVSGSAPAAPAAPSPSRPPRPEEYEDLGHGRDYAPGLAGKYTTSTDDNAADFEYKRAVGD
jgi:hypothetical protein